MPQLDQVGWVLFQNTERILFHGWRNTIKITLRFLFVPEFLLEHENGGIAFSTSSFAPVYRPEPVEASLHVRLLFQLIVFGELRAHGRFQLGFKGVK
jgi:hypothetical protein